MKIALGADHRGFDLKESLRKSLSKRGIEAVDFGPDGTDSVDYPDYARPVSLAVSDDNVDQGILICGSGLGMSIAANKVPRIRAALCLTPEMASLARNHNNANVLVLSADMTSAKDAEEILGKWLETDFEMVIRHKRRIQKIKETESNMGDPLAVYDRDPDVYAAIQAEAKRQQDQIVLIASENLAIPAIREAQGSIMTNKYAEGYPGKRWYNGCANMDDVEALAIERVKKLFGAEHANVQPHSGTAANMAVYFSVLDAGDTIMAMKLDHGGHLSHGNPVNFSGRLFNVVSYGVHEETEQIDYGQIAAMAAEHKPKMIVAGCSSYSRIIDFKRFRDIADSVGAYLMVDMAHIAGLIAGGCHPSPVPCADFVTSTTHKTLAGPRGGFILCRERFAAEIDKQVFPGQQGGPLMHVIAGKAVCFHEALRPSFKTYQQAVVTNTNVLTATLMDGGLRVVSGGTDNHLALLDLRPIGVTGKDAAGALEDANIIVNKNSIPFDTESPFVTSGIRVGAPTCTSRGMGKDEMVTIGGLIIDVVKHIGKDAVIAKTRETVAELTEKFPTY